MIIKDPTLQTIPALQTMLEIIQGDMWGIYVSQNNNARDFLEAIKKVHNVAEQFWDGAIPDTGNYHTSRFVFGLDEFPSKISVTVISDKNLTGYIYGDPDRFLIDPPTVYETLAITGGTLFKNIYDNYCPAVKLQFDNSSGAEAAVKLYIRFFL